MSISCQNHFGMLALRYPLYYKLFIIKCRLSNINPNIDLINSDRQKEGVSEILLLAGGILPKSCGSWSLGD